MDDPITVIELYAIRRDGYDNETIKALIRHGVLVPIHVTVTTQGIDETTQSDVQSEVTPDVPVVDWSGGAHEYEGPRDSRRSDRSGVTACAVSGRRFHTGESDHDSFTDSGRRRVRADEDRGDGSDGPLLHAGNVPDDRLDRASSVVREWLGALAVQWAFALDRQRQRLDDLALRANRDLHDHHYTTPRDEHDDVYYKHVAAYHIDHHFAAHHHDYRGAAKHYHDDRPVWVHHYGPSIDDPPTGHDRDD